nr:UBN2 domain-containing protein [Tanacetum cinerariifolium]
MEDPKTNMVKETLYELLKDDEKKKLWKNNEAKMILYNALPHKDYKIDLLTQQYEMFSISSEENIDSGFTRFNVIVTSLNSLDQDYPNKNHVRKFLQDDGIVFNTTKGKVKSLALKSKVTWEKTNDDSNSQRGSEEDDDDDKEFN